MGNSQSYNNLENIEMEEITDDIKLLSSIHIPFNLPSGIGYNFYIDGKVCYAFVYEEDNQRKIMYSRAIDEQYRNVIKSFIKDRFKDYV